MKTNPQESTAIERSCRGGGVEEKGHPIFVIYLILITGFKSKVKAWKLVLANPEMEPVLVLAVYRRGTKVNK